MRRTKVGTRKYVVSERIREDAVFMIQMYIPRRSRGSGCRSFIIRSLASNGKSTLTQKVSNFSSRSALGHVAIAFTNGYTFACISSTSVLLGYYAGAH
jgi:hypothetical protein